MLLSIATVLAAYLLGSVSTAIVVCRLSGLPDPRSQGSRNPGATNVLRTGRKGAAIITLLGDSLKGLVPVLVAHALGLEPFWVAAVALAAFLGHLYPIYHGFQGGKGVATALGVLLGLNVFVGLAALATWLLVAALARISSLAALTAAALTPVYMYLLTGETWYVAAGAALAALIFWRHRANIDRLARGEEPRIGKS
ncbi:acyl-phosphate glycerol 3-phosphate acyltransferase [Thioalkalivibrio denitrificans]|uniref:Glycerol-3-phosphate acyltransferase n=1 Tax=Thioalkalivibrio denitrificans TaxID=108003 RepID=A0A1V3NDC1_9GAMM|nr:glycerol-3-phosphate 1-O-acyltransferase PlsY [Thioalkalivibrio denitrificans]OOG23097.1 acyl-phosphate glycerol 3-phosphate acyltransferase [Thioalkalivibrio denitrificans]